ncbi:MAG: hypothetical protein ACYC9W_05920 [Candidatus Limnocylindria bacterium]
MAIAGEIALGLLGLTFAAQGFGLTRSYRSAMNDRPEWVVIGGGMFVLALVLIWRTSRRSAPA